MTTTDITAAAASRLAVGTRIRDRRVELAATLPKQAIDTTHGDIPGISFFMQEVV